MSATFTCAHCGTEFNAPQGDRDAAWAAFDTECDFHDAGYCVNGLKEDL